MLERLLSTSLVLVLVLATAHPASAAHDFDMREHVHVHVPPGPMHGQYRHIANSLSDMMRTWQNSGPGPAAASAKGSGSRLMHLMDTPSPSPSSNSLTYAGGEFPVAGLYTRQNSSSADYSLFDYISDVICDVWKMMEVAINANGGVLINGVAYRLKIYQFNVGYGFSDEAIAAVTKTANDIITHQKYGYFPIILAPLSLTTSLVISLAGMCDANQRIMLAMDVADYVYQCPDPVDPVYGADCISRNKRPGERRYQSVFSTLLPGSRYWDGTVSNLRVAGAKTAIVINADDPAMVVAGTSVVQLMEQSGIHVLYHYVLPWTDLLANETVSDTIVSHLQSTYGNVDVLLVHTNAATEGFLNSMMKYNYIAKSVIFAVPPGVYNPQALVGGPDSTRYLITAIQFDPRLKATVSKTTFPHDLFVSSVDPVTGQYRDDAATRAYAWFLNSSVPYSPFHPLTAATLVVIQRALEEIQGINYTTPQGCAPSVLGNCSVISSSTMTPFIDQLRIHIQNMYQESFYGKLHFDSFGRYATDALVWQTSADHNLEIVYPLNSATANFIYPIPTWEERTYTPSYAKLRIERIVLAVAAVALFVIITLSIAVFKFRAERVIRSASPVFMLIMLLGCALMLASIFTWTLYETNSSCSAHVWLFSLGYVLMFSPLFAKTWRLYTIFCSQQFALMSITDVKLALRGPIPMVIIEILLLIIWHSSAPFQAHTVFVDPIRPALNYDSCYYNDVSVGVFYASIAYKVGILLVGCVLIFLARNIPGEYNETPYIAAAIYQVLFTAAILIPIVSTDALSRETRFVVRSLGIVGSTVLAASTLCVPKLYALIIGQADSNHNSSGFEMSGPRGSLRRGRKGSAQGPVTSHSSTNGVHAKAEPAAAVGHARKSSGSSIPSAARLMGAGAGASGLVSSCTPALAPHPLALADISRRSSLAAPGDPSTPWEILEQALLAIQEKHAQPSHHMTQQQIQHMQELWTQHIQQLIGTGNRTVAPHNPPIATGTTPQQKQNNSALQRLSPISSPSSPSASPSSPPVAIPMVDISLDEVEPEPIHVPTPTRLLQPQHAHAANSI